jgi:hypothetical protein
VALWAALLVVAWGHVAWALDRGTEAAAKQALLQAVKDHAAGDDDGAVLRLAKARRACGSNRCSAFVRASIQRDSGAYTFLRGEKAQASALFGEALDLVANLPWNPLLDAPELLAEWADVKNERYAIHERRPEGDFEHEPPTEQAVNTPLPIYAELNATGVASVVVKYKVPGEDEFKKRTLRRFGGGWGGTIPCKDVKRGLLRYFLQAFDDQGIPIANSGDVKHLYFVPIRWAINGDPPHLPGQSAPEPCTGEAGPEEEIPEPAPGQGPANVARYVHFWIGVSGSLDVAFMPGGSDVCALSMGTPVNDSFYCTNPDGSDFPQRGKAPSITPVKGQSGASSSGPTLGNVRVLVAFDYAVNTHFLTGARIGYVAESYPGAAASNDGHEISTPIHLELRETYLIGPEPLAHAGFAPYIFASAGYAKIDASQTSSAQLTGVTGPRPVVVWAMGGPFFVAAGGGARYAFSPRIAFLAGLKAALPFGAAGILPTLSPEALIQYGF